VSVRRAQPAPPASLLANLAATPFVNRRPVQRFILAAWLVGALLTGLNVLLWVQYRHQSTALRARLAETRAAVERTSKSMVDMDAQLRGLRLPAQNAQIEFLNGRIAERTFPWSLLFERIASTLPDGVRLASLTPVFEREAEGRARKAKNEPAPAPEDEVIALKIRGMAKTDESLYQLIDAFFASPAFAHPRLFNENAGAGGEVEFAVDVDYKPRYSGDRSHQPAAHREPGDEGSSEEGAGEEDAGDPDGDDGDRGDEEDATAASRARRAVAPRIVEVTE
jgi:hypothetical protein